MLKVIADSYNLGGNRGNVLIDVESLNIHARMLSARVVELLRKWDRSIIVKSEIKLTKV